MIDINIPILTVSLCGLFEYGCVLAADREKPSGWKIGLLVGVGSSGLAAFGFARPELDPWAMFGLNSWMTFGLGTLYMMITVFYGYYRNVPFTTEVEIHRRKGILRELLLGLVFIVFMTVLIGFMQGQSSMTKVNQQNAYKVDTLTSIVSAMYYSLMQSNAKLDALGKKVDGSDSKLAKLEALRIQDVKDRKKAAEDIKLGVEQIMAEQRASKKQARKVSDRAESQEKPRAVKPSTAMRGVTTPSRIVVPPPVITPRKKWLGLF